MHYSSGIRLKMVLKFLIVDLLVFKILNDNSNYKILNDESQIEIDISKTRMKRTKTDALFYRASE